MANDTTLTFNTRNATLMRSGEKKILLHIVSFVNQMLNYFSMDQNEVRNAMKNTEHTADGKAYIKRVILPLLKDAE